MTKILVIYKNQYDSLAIALKGDQVFRYTQDNMGFYSKYLGSVEVDRLPRSEKGYAKILAEWEDVVEYDEEGEQ